MKKYLLLVISALFVISVFAADLNPFAYDLKSEYNPNTLTLTVNFSLNAPATYMKLAISDGTRDVWAKEYKGGDYASGKVPKKDYQEVIDVSDLPAGVDLTWRVDVKGAAVSTPTFVKNDVRLYAPTSVDIDNNPENANFGTVFCVEGLNGAYQTSGYTGYISYEDGAGLYLLNADGSARKMPYQTERVRYGYNGGVVNQPNRTRPFFGNNGTNDLKGYHAYRVRVSDDGRIFITAFSTNGHVLWEAKKDCFSATTQDEWSANTGWHKIMTDDDANTFMATEKRTCSHTYCGIYSLYEGDATSGKFIAGPNLGFDVRGSGDNLKLLMLAGCKQAIVYSTPAHFYCDEYDLGTAHLLNDPQKRTRIFAGHSNDPKGIDIVNPQGVQVQYDKSGNVWVCQHRAETDNTTLARVNRALAATQTDRDNNVEGGHLDYSESTHSFRRCGAIRFNEDFTQVAIASNANGNGGGFTVYPVDQSTGLPIWDLGTQVNTNSKTGVSLMDFAWDYAGNLYIAADAATNGERIAVYAMPHTADRVVSTPAAKKYAFSVNCQAGKQCTVTTICNPSEAGTITCSVGGNARAAGVLTLASCTELTVTATPDEGYKFINWTDGNGNMLSTNNQYSFYVTEDITLKANFEYATYTGIVWKNLFMNGEDIADVESAECSGRNERLWRLFQVDWNEEFSASRADQGYTKNTYEFDVAGYVTRDNSVAMFTQSSRPFRWLGKYMMNVVGDTIVNGTYWGISGINIWGYYLYAFINRTNKVYNSQDQAMGSDSKVDFSKFPTYGKPEYWRPYWAEHACGLKATMTYDEYMPTVTTWKRPECSTGYITKNGTSTKIYPSSWHKWNHPAYDASIADVPYKKYFILAWRKGSPTAEEIVHHVYESNMELHASYVLKNIDENDRVDPNNHDASNDDVIKLMQNRHWVNLDPNPNVHPTHTLTVTRKLQAGMYNTICLPFGVDLTGLQDNNEYHHPLKDAEAWEYTGTTPTYNESGDPVVVLNFKEVNLLEAGKPYLIKMQGNTDLSEDMTFSTVSCFADLHPSQGGGLIFEPTINPTTVPAGSLILVADNRLALTTQEGTMAGMRGYFRIDESDPILASDIMEQAAAGRVYLSMNKPTTTSVPVAPEAEKQTQPEVRKVMIDGKIYIVRGEEVYTITGNRVK
ncbi:MAG: hypothetical protein J6R26_01395 [Paludibacteraceae bacterium]|nr:hypothetical protein [Paludibacteraceae bacterium]